MRNSLKKSQRKQDQELQKLQRWEIIRAKGPVPFILRTMLTFSLTMIGVFDVMDHVLYGGGRASTILTGGGWYLIGGFIMGISGWTSMEARYKDALTKATLKASPSGALPARNNPLSISPDSLDR